MMTTSQVGDLLSYLATFDSYHATNSQEAFATKTDAWHDILKDRDYEDCKRIIANHYASSDAKKITVGHINTLAAHAEGARNRPTGNSPEDAARRERACSVPECRCTHTECFAGFLDEDVVTKRNSATYKAAKRCPQCARALEARTAVA